MTLAPDSNPAELLAQIDTREPGASVKDSFADLDLTESGFGVLFEAQWIWRPAGMSATGAEHDREAASASVHPSSANDPLHWETVSDPEALREWAMAWDEGNGNASLFGPALLEDADTFVLAGRNAAGRTVAGAVASRSDETVGVSNLFALEGGADAAWPGVLSTLHDLFPTLPVVGYESGEDLAAAIRHGFESIGPLRVWIHGL